MSIIERLTEGMVQRDLAKEGTALLNKWERTGLLEGIRTERAKHTMARLLENQAKELLRESNTMAGGDVEGFAAVAFPIVRRVFAGLIANDLVSVQPMSLPSGLIFFLDFKVSDNAGAPRLGYGVNDSLYGGGVLGQQITGGVSLTGANAEKSFYNMNNGYSSPTGSLAIVTTLVASGTVTDGGIPVFGGGTAAYTALSSLLRFDPDLVSGSAFAVATVTLATFKAAAAQFNDRDFVAISFVSGTAAGTATLSDGRLVRRLTRIDPTDSTKVLFTIEASVSETSITL